MVFESSLRKVASALYVHLNTPRSLTALILMRYGEWDQLVSLRADPRNFIDTSIGAERFRKDAQASDFLRKSPLVPIKRDLEAAAIKTFHECENRCLLTNQLLGLLDDAVIGEMPILGRMRHVVAHARKIIGRILGPVPATLDGSFGPGTSFELRGSTYTTLADKLWITPHTTPSCAPVFEHMFWPTLWGRTRLAEGLPLPTLCRGNRFTTVPKDCTKRRGICIEPLGNLFCQLAIGGYLKRRLSAVGIHVSPATEISDPIQRLTTRPPPEGQAIHRLTACQGSIDGSWATIDLSNASDTVAFELVRRLLPPDWFALLSSCRSPYTYLKGKWVRLEKFSSMGNGFTFELETLLFVALSAAVAKLVPGRDLFVYGDDILIPSAADRDVRAVLEAFGFEVNQEKSFSSGPFRESCGGDFFLGYNVRSCFATKDMDNSLQWIALHNELVRRWGHTLASRRCVDAIPLIYRVGVPRKLGHLGLWISRFLRTKVEDGCTYVRTVVNSPRPIPLDRWGDSFTVALAVLGVQSGGLVPRGAVNPKLGWYSIS